METGRRRRVLVVSSDDARTTPLCEHLEAAGLDARIGSPDEAAALVAGWRPDAVLLDAEAIGPSWRLDDGGGERTYKRVLLTDDPGGATATLALRLDADTVLPWGAAQNLWRVFDWDAGPEPDVATSGALPPFVTGSAPAMREVWRRVFLAAPDDTSVLIYGETGSGKEVVARALHRFSSRRDGPFVAVNCAALPDGLLESELFGHERGAFTGAGARRQGRFELADGGTLLLDEIGDLPMALQAKLLRVLQERAFERLGGAERVHVDVRVLAATHRDLAQACESGRFRPDLHYRLDAFTIHVPPLRECREDVLPLWTRFVEEGAARRGRRPPELSEAARRLLLRHDWPGNVRELQNAAAHALTLCRGDVIEPIDLPDRLRRAPVRANAPRMLGMTLEDAERELILQTYEALQSPSATAAMLGISVRKVQYRLKSFRDEGLLASDRPPSDPPPEPPRPHVLLAEDDDEMRWALEDFLEAGGFDVTAVASGGDALDALAAPGEAGAPPAVLVTDVRMPGVGGLELLEALRRRGSSLPAIVITAFDDDALRDQALALGVDALLAKPIDTDELERAIRRVVT